MAVVEPVVRRKGWLIIPGVQDGERTLAEQLIGLDAAFAVMAGKTVCDLGCAEGLITLECVKGGAASAFGLDCNVDNIAIAEEMAIRAGAVGRVHFARGDVQDWLRGAPARYDIVLALAILHKLRDPVAATRQVAGIARSLVVIRLPGGSTGTFHAKHNGAFCDVPEVMTSEGWVLNQDVPGPRGERTQYWRPVP